jgi:hypothetical protein
MSGSSGTGGVEKPASGPPADGVRQSRPDARKLPCFDDRRDGILPAWRKAFKQDGSLFPVNSSPRPFRSEGRRPVPHWPTEFLSDLEALDKRSRKGPGPVAEKRCKTGLSKRARHERQIQEILNLGSRSKASED